MIDFQRFEKAISLFPKLKTLVVGDLVLDEYLFGQTTRISREAPVPIVELERGEHRPGGSANTAANMASMGAKASAVGVVGDDRNGDALLEALSSRDVDTKSVLRDKTRPTTSKTRVMAGDVNTTRQQLLRMDMGSRQALDPSVAMKISAFIEKNASKYHAIAFSDYGFGILDETIVKSLRRAVKTIPVVADSRFGLMFLSGFTAVTPNEPETEDALDSRLDNDKLVAKAGALLLRKLDAQHVLITRGNKGMALFGKAAKPLFLGIAEDTEAVDVTGAGDTVVAAFTLSLAAGLTAAEAAIVSNHAASVAVSRSGAVAVTADEILSSLSGWER